MSAAPSIAVERLSKKNRDRLRLALTPRTNEFMRHVPTAKQHAALLLDRYREVFYGGAAGGGKSDWILASGLQYVDVPGYAALILRRTFAQLSKADALLERAQEWLAGTRAQGVDSVSGVPTTWLFPSGARLEFGHCQYEKNRFDYLSAAYQFIGFDELTQFTERIYLYLMSRLRRLEGAPVPLRVRGASNPGDVGHDWVKDRLVESRHPDRVFIPAKLADNPYLDREEYEKTLSELHPYERAQLLDGDWDVRPPGGKFKREWFPIMDAVPSDIVALVRYWDLAATEDAPGVDPDFTAGAKMGRTPMGLYPILDVQHFRASPRGVSKRIEQTAKLDGVRTKVCIEREPGASGKFVIQSFVNLLAGYTVKGVPATGNKFLRMDPFASQAEAGNVPLLRGPWVEPFLRELEMISNDESHPFDDQGDAASGAFKEVSSRKLGMRRASLT